MLAKRVDELPSGEDWIFEPKWDGFRALVFRDGDEILIQSRDEKPLNRYFPELLDPLRSALPSRCVLDGEIVVVKNSGLDFEELQLRLHPAASRVRLLSQQSPASIVFFDLLCEADHNLCCEAFNTSASARASRKRNAANLPVFWLPTARTRSAIIPGSNGRSTTREWRKRDIACLGARAAGAKVRTSRGSRCVRSSSSKSLMITCK